MEKNRDKKRVIKVMATFCIAFGIVMAAGMSVLMGYYFITSNQLGRNASGFFAEAIPQGSGQGISQNEGSNSPTGGLTLPGGEPQNGGSSSSTEGLTLPGGEPQDGGSSSPTGGLTLPGGEPQDEGSSPSTEELVLPETESPKKEKEVVLGFGGDILFDPNYSIMASLIQRGKGLAGAFSSDLLEAMKKVDIMMLNNEFPYSNRGMPREGKKFTFRAKPDSVELLKEMGVDIVSLANNHAFDYGEEALLDTLETLKGAGIPYVGAGVNLEEAAAPVYFTMGDLKLAYVSATQIERLENPDTRGATDTLSGVFRCLNPTKLLEVVREAKANSDFVVVYIHWGTENVVNPDWAQLDQAPKLVEAGADLIIGDHPHCLQPIEYIQGVPVLYSLGNFLFNSKKLDTCLIKVVVNGEGIKALQFLPALQENCFTSLLENEEKERVLEYMRSISPKIAIDEDGYITPK